MFSSLLLGEKLLRSRRQQCIYRACLVVTRVRGDLQCAGRDTGAGTTVRH